VEILPAIDIKEGQCVRLYKGDFEQETVYGEPVEMAKLWAKKGAQRLHIVDLDGAKAGEPQNLELITEIKETVDLPLQVGGGIRNRKMIKQYLENGVDRVIIGTAAIKNPELVIAALEEFGAERIVVGIDAKNGQVATEGWVETAATTAVELGKKMKQQGVKWVVYTDISRDGTLTGPNIESTRQLAEETGLNVIASGGVSSLDDIRQVKKIESVGVKGVITGKALYSGSLDLEEAIDLINN